MSGLLARQERSIGPEFARCVTVREKAAKKRPAPLSLRLSDGERARLETEADGVPLRAFIKSRIFSDDSDSASPTRSLVQDYELLAQLLAALGQSKLFANLDVLARQVEAGKLTLSPEAEFEIGVACACVLQMRDDLIYALGLRAGGD